MIITTYGRILLTAKSGRAVILEAHKQLESAVPIHVRQLRRIYSMIDDSAHDVRLCIVRKLYNESVTETEAPECQEYHSHSVTLHSTVLVMGDE
jgi:hypothetical protein